MMRFRFLNKILLSLVIAASLVMFTHIMAQAQFFPISYYYTSPFAFTNYTSPFAFTNYTSPFASTDYTYANTINETLLGYLPFSPFLDPIATALYSFAGIPTYPFTYEIINQYTTTVPFTTLDPLSPYALPDYPTYLYGDPAWYKYWVLLNW